MRERNREKEESDRMREIQIERELSHEKVFTEKDKKILQKILPSLLLHKSEQLIEILRV